MKWCNLEFLEEWVQLGMRLGSFGFEFGFWFLYHVGYCYKLYER